jgi:rhamnulokinase
MERSGKKYTWNEIVQMGKSIESEPPLINPNDELFFNPSNMIDAVKQYFIKTGQTNEADLNTIICSVYESMAYSYLYAIHQVESITNQCYSVIHIVGGGSKNHFLNQLTADVANRKVTAGPVEATSLGNLGIQLKYHNRKLDLKEIRRILKNSSDIAVFHPEPSKKLEKRYELYSRLAKEK